MFLLVSLCRVSSVCYHQFDFFNSEVLIKKQRIYSSTYTTLSKLEIINLLNLLNQISYK